MCYDNGSVKVVQIRFNTFPLLYPEKVLLFKKTRISRGLVMKTKNVLIASGAVVATALTVGIIGANAAPAGSNLTAESYGTFVYDQNGNGVISEADGDINITANDIQNLTDVANEYRQWRNNYQSVIDESIRTSTQSMEATIQNSLNEAIKANKKDITDTDAYLKGAADDIEAYTKNKTDNLMQLANTISNSVERTVVYGQFTIANNETITLVDEKGSLAGKNIQNVHINYAQNYGSLPTYTLDQTAGTLKVSFPDPLPSGTTITIRNMTVTYSAVAPNDYDSNISSYATWVANHESEGTNPSSSINPYSTLKINGAMVGSEWVETTYSNLYIALGALVGNTDTKFGTDSDTVHYSTYNDSLTDYGKARYLVKTSATGESAGLTSMTLAGTNRYNIAGSGISVTADGENDTTAIWVRIR